jgi:hypothetical protein
LLELALDVLGFVAVVLGEPALALGALGRFAGGLLVLLSRFFAFWVNTATRARMAIATTTMRMISPIDMLRQYPPINW